MDTGFRDVDLCRIETASSLLGLYHGQSLVLINSVEPLCDIKLCYICDGVA